MDAVASIAPGHGLDARLQSFKMKSAFLPLKVEIPGVNYDQYQTVLKGISVCDYSS